MWMKMKSISANGNHSRTRSTSKHQSAKRYENGNEKKKKRRNYTIRDEMLLQRRHSTQICMNELKQLRLQTILYFRLEKNVACSMCVCVCDMRPAIRRTHHHVTKSKRPLFGVGCYSVRKMRYLHKIFVRIMLLAKIATAIAKRFENWMYYRFWLRNRKLSCPPFPSAGPCGSAHITVYLCMCVCVHLWRKNSVCQTNWLNMCAIKV